MFKQFRLVPKQFDYPVNSMRVMMDRVRTQERLIMKLCVEQCKMPKKNFITLFTGNETSETWFNAAIAMNKPWSEKLHDGQMTFTAACRNCSRLKKKPA